MPLVPAKCTNCGAVLTIDSSKDAAICEYCNTPFVIEKAINNYNIQNSVIHIHQEAEKRDEFEIIGGTLVRYNGKDKHVKIPKGVVKIGRQCFKDMAIESVEFNESIVSIGGGAFAGCNCLKSIEIPNTVKELEGMAFSCCVSLEYAFYPKSITTSAGSTFEYCTSLKEIEIEDGVEIIPVDFARGCTALQSINIPSSVCYIYTKAFFGTDLKQVTIPQSVRVIDVQAFANCKHLYTVYMQTVTKGIATDAFMNTPWQEQKWAGEGRCTRCGGKKLFGKCMNCFSR